MSKRGSKALEDGGDGEEASDSAASNGPRFVLIPCRSKGLMVLTKYECLWSPEEMEPLHPTNKSIMMYLQLRGMNA